MISATTSSAVEWDELKLEHSKFFALCAELAEQQSALLVEGQSRGVSAFGIESMTKGYFILMPPRAADDDDEPPCSLLMKVRISDIVDQE